MKIALVVAGGLHKSGREQIIPALLAFVERLAQANEVHAFVLRHLRAPQTYTLAGATIHDLGSPGGRVAMGRALSHAMGATGPFDIVHGYWGDPPGVLAAWIGRRFGVPSVVTCDSGEFVSFPEIEYGAQRTAIGKLAIAYACRRATAVHVTSHHMERLARDHGIETVRVPIGIDVRRFSRLARPDDGPPYRVLQVASLNAVKDQPTLLRAISRVRQNLDVHLDLVGEDTRAGEIQRHADSLGIRQAVTFHGFLSQDRLTELFASAHLYAQSSLHEAAGVAVLEAAAAGLPIVGTRVGFVSDWAGTAATATPPRDSGALANAIGALLTDGAQRARLSAAARVRVRDYDADVTAAQMMSLYASIREKGLRRSSSHFGPRR